MDVREKLVELIDEIIELYPSELEKLADGLIAHGVTVQELDGCCRCKDTSEMTVTISNKLVAGVRTGWLGGNLPARYCPFCGRRLPQPPKGE